MEFNGKLYKPFNGAFNDSSYASCIVGKRGAAPISHRGSKVTTLDAVMELINDGDVISYPHYYRTGDVALKMIIDKLRETGKRNIILYANAIFDNTDPWLIEAKNDGVIQGIYGNIYRKFGARVMAGEMLPWVGVGFSHGNRVRKLQTGEVHIKVAFGPVPIADTHGNANGMMGKEEHYCGPVGLFLADAEYADYTCLMAGTVSEHLIMPGSISMELTDFIVKVDDPGLSSGIGSGTLNIAHARENKFNAMVADNVTRLMHASGAVQDMMNFQVGSGAGLLVLDNIRKALKEENFTANFAIGGVTSLHVDMLDEGTLKHLLHVQLFEPSVRVVQSLLNHPGHHETSAGCYASVAGKECAVNMLDFAVLSALEVDLDFNVNTVCANGRIIGGIGGGQDVAAGSDLTVIFLPLARGKDGKGFPKVVKEVYTRTTPGEVIDAVVTEDYAVVNPASKSSCKERIIEQASKYDLKLISIEELHEKSLAKARSFGHIPEKAEITDDIVHIIEWRDGTLLDTVKKLV
ncbi:hypothetical protein KAR48_03165 [bacterium]|nr:hypothetical protein [bacterium]